MSREQGSCSADCMVRTQLHNENDVYGAGRCSRVVRASLPRFRHCAMANGELVHRICRTGSDRVQGPYFDISQQLQGIA